MYAELRYNPPNIVLVSDDTNDLRLLREAFDDAGTQVYIKTLAEKHNLMDWLKREIEINHADWPDMVFLNLSGKTKLEDLRAIKTHESFKRIPVIVLWQSAKSKDIKKAYDYHANCFIQKPDSEAEYRDLIRILQNFWFNVARLPVY